MVLTVTLLGGESSGKTTLAQTLHAQLGTYPDLRAVLVPERLRRWCERESRAPLQHEQAARAAEQTAALDKACRTPGVTVVIADTSALMIAAYSEQYFNDRSLWADALERQRRVDLTLLMGLDLPWVADGLFRDSPTAREATDTLLRRELLAAGIPFQTLYGPVNIRVQQALRAIGNLLERPLGAERPEWANGRRPWLCEKCSDPECEHRLFTDLLQQRQQPIEP